MQRVMGTCRACGHRGPMERVRGEYRVNWWAFGLLLVFTLGVGLMATPLWLDRPRLVRCGECGATRRHW